MKQVHVADLSGATPLDGRGQRSPTDVLVRTIRDRLLRTAADRFCVGMSDRQAAAMLRSKLGQYREGAWQRDRSEVRCPDRHRGKINELLYAILTTRDHVPGDKTVRNALALDPFSIAHDQ